MASSDIAAAPHQPERWLEHAGSNGQRDGGLPPRVGGGSGLLGRRGLARAPFGSACRACLWGMICGRCWMGGARGVALAVGAPGGRLPGFDLTFSAPRRPTIRRQLFRAVTRMQPHPLCVPQTKLLRGIAGLLESRNSGTHRAATLRPPTGWSSCPGFVRQWFLPRRWAPRQRTPLAR